MPDQQLSGVVALQGGGPFEHNDPLDRTLLEQAGVDRVVMLPTADAFEQPRRARRHGAGVGVADGRRRRAPDGADAL